ncbi:Hsp20/alpha crystallin family protein, partial [Kineococcus glutinatus]|uniref:Hsp20/alpha crystallin family protein n=1 Tax=Kineococcus glutinatus TaxID=1070872 RepID=UPI0031E8E765
MSETSQQDASPSQPAEATVRAQRREQVLFERERATARRRAQRGGRAHPSVAGEQVDAGWWAVQQVRADGEGDGRLGEAHPHVRDLPAGSVPAEPELLERAPVPPPVPDAGGGETVTVPVTMPLTVPVDLWQVPGGYVVALDLPGIDPTSTRLALTGGSLTVRAERTPPPARGRTALLLERPHGTVTRQVVLPEGVQVHTGAVDYRDGVLLVTLTDVRAPGAPPPAQEPARRIDLAGDERP